MTRRDELMKHVAIAGSPVAQALSPVLHTAAYTALGLNWTYGAVECEVAGLPRLFESLDETWAGLSLTMPLKRAALELVDEVSAIAATSGAINTVTVHDGRLFGENTDVYGLVAALAEAGIYGADQATIVGGGATAGSALVALDSLGVGHVRNVVRNPANTGLTSIAASARVNVEVLPWRRLHEGLDTELIILALPPGAADNVAPLLNNYRGGLLDVVYGPRPTAVSVVAAAAGARVASGFSMLLHQAAEQVTLQTGVDAAPIDAMRLAGENALSDAHRRVLSPDSDSRYAERPSTAAYRGTR